MATSKVTAPRKRSKSKNELSDRQAERLFKKIEKAPAWFASRDEVWKFNKTVDEMQWIRRVGTILLEMSGKDLIKRVAEERDFATTFVAWYDRVGEYDKLLDDLKGMIAHVQARFMIALAGRADMEEVIAEGRKAESGNIAAAAMLQ